MVSDTREKTAISPVLVLVGAIALAVAGFFAYQASQPREAPPPPGITAEAKEYVQYLKLSGVEMKATANFAGASVVEIVGNIGNTGGRPLERVELNCVFYDTAGLVVLRERVAIVRSALPPGETRSFRLPFENIPKSWNQTMPQLVIAHIAFAG